MRYITSDMLNKANKRIQSVATNANPKMKVLTSRGLVREMFRVFDVEDTAIGASTNSDVTIQRSTFGRPSQIFLTHLKNGQIEVKTKKLPYYEDVPWSLAFVISDPSGIKDSAIEFDGYWQRKQGEKRFDFISEELPYIFYVTNSGELYCQKWSKGADKIQLATGVRAISVVRGWVPVQAGHYDDQGLIVAYIKSDGMVYYRNYCINLAGSKSWEIERLVPGLPSGAVRVSTFRTNDFRVGFLAETSAGAIHMAVTDRNWAGMSFEPENISAMVSGLNVDLIPLKFTDIEAPNEHVSASVSDMDVQLCPLVIPDLTLVSAVKESSNRIVAAFDHDIVSVDSGAFTIAGNTVTVEKGLNGNEIYINTLSSLGMFVTANYVAGTIEYKVCDTCKIAFAGTIDITLYDNLEVTENISVSISSMTELLSLNFLDFNSQAENILASVTGSTIELIDVGDIPV